MIPYSGGVKPVPVEVYTDGAISNVALPYSIGGWAYYIPSLESLVGGSAQNCTSNQMELLGVVRALSDLFLRYSIDYEECKYCLAMRGCQLKVDCKCSGDCDFKKKIVFPYPVTIYSDSQYVVNSFNEYQYGWQLNDWKTKEGSPVKNQELMKALFKIGQYFDVTVEWVKGHSGVAGNELVDAMAKYALKSKIKLINPSSTVKYKVPEAKEVSVIEEFLDFKQKGQVDAHLEELVYSKVPPSPGKKMLFA